MTFEHIMDQIRIDLPKLKSDFGVNRIGLFGSYATRQETEESDLDFLVELQPPIANHYFKLLSFLEQKFDKKIDLVRRGKHLSDGFIKHVESEIVYA